MVINVKDFSRKEVVFTFDVIIGLFVILEMGCKVRKYIMFNFFCADPYLSYFRTLKFKVARFKLMLLVRIMHYLKKFKLVALTREH
jgi:hypothetical protein